jgi:hypothetical protein
MLCLLHFGKHPEMRVNRQNRSKINQCFLLPAMPPFVRNNPVLGYSLDPGVSSCAGRIPSLRDAWFVSEAMMRDGVTIITDN